MAQVSISSRLTRHSSAPVRLVERDDERPALVIPDARRGIAVQHRRRALAELVAHLLVAEVLLPDELAVHVVGVEPLRLERRDDVLAVGDRRARRPGAVVLMRALVRRRLARGLLPDAPCPSFRSSAITTKRCTTARAWPCRAARARSPASIALGTAVSTKTRSPHTTGVPEPRPGISTFQRTFFDSLHSVGGIGGSRHAGHQWPAPLGPELVGALLRHERHGQGEQASACTPPVSGFEPVDDSECFPHPDLIRPSGLHRYVSSPGLNCGALDQPP